MLETHPRNRLGYARVSTSGQTLDVQLEQLRGAGCSIIYREKVTGAHNDRRELLRMLAALAPGDMVDGDADRPPRALDLRSVRQLADRRRDPHVQLAKS